MNALTTELPAERTLDELLERASRTFALTIPLLEGDLRQAMAVAYLLMRNADTLEDAFRIPRRVRAEGLAVWTGIVADGDVGYAHEWVGQWSREDRFDDPEHREVLLETPRLLRELDALPPALGDVVRSHVVRVALRMREWVLRHDDQERLTLDSVRELDDYCYAVAGIVGEMITDLLERTLDLPLERRLFLRSLAFDFGAGLQLTNVLKDAWRDAQAGRRYVPPDFAPGRPDGHVEAERQRPIVLLALSRLEQGMSYTLALPVAERGVRLFCLLPLLLAAATLREVDGRADRLWRGVDVKIDRDEVARLVAAAHAAVDDNAAVSALWDDIVAPIRGLRLAMSA